MLPPDYAALLRCPMDPTVVRLDMTDTGLVCQRCRLTFAIRDGIPNMLVEEAQLPPGCSSLEQLPCRQGK